MSLQALPRRGRSCGGNRKFGGRTRYFLDGIASSDDHSSEKTTSMRSCTRCRGVSSSMFISRFRPSTALGFSIKMVVNAMQLTSRGWLFLGLFMPQVLRYLSTQKRESCDKAVTVDGAFWIAPEDTLISAANPRVDLRYGISSEPRVWKMRLPPRRMKWKRLSPSTPLIFRILKFSRWIIVSHDAGLRLHST